MMEEAVTRRVLHDESCSVLSLCGKLSGQADKQTNKQPNHAH